MTRRPLADWLREKRDAESIRAFAKRLGLSRAEIRYLEAGGFSGQKAMMALYRIWPDETSKIISMILCAGMGE